jgi:transcription initiation factor IIF auxiliary subunit
MVTKSTVNYEQWKQDVYEIYKVKYPKLAKKFIEYISRVYDKIGRVFFQPKVMWYLIDKKALVQNGNQHFWIAFVGRKGGEGKSTLAKQILHFLDPTFNSDERTARNYDEFIKLVHKLKVVEKIKYPSILIDEQDPEVHTLSKKGKKLKNILSKLRQLNLYVAACGNSLSEIPIFVYHRLSALCYINYKHRFWLYDESKDRRGTIIDDIKGEKGWGMFGHAVFQKPMFTKRAHFKNMTFSPNLPFVERKYDSEKKKDVIYDIEDYIKDKNEPNNTQSIVLRDPRQNIDYLLMDSLLKNGIKQKEIAKKFNCNKATVLNRKKKLIELGQISIIH